LCSPNEAGFPAARAEEKSDFNENSEEDGKDGKKGRFIERKIGEKKIEGNSRKPRISLITRVF
jgi:hypothetical protein